MAGKSGRSINNVPQNPIKQMIFSWEGILVILFILVNIFCASFSEFYPQTDAGLSGRSISHASYGIYSCSRRN